MPLLLMTLKTFEAHDFGHEAAESFFVLGQHYIKKGWKARDAQGPWTSWTC